MSKLQFLQATRNAFYPPPAGVGPLLDFIDYTDLSGASQTGPGVILASSQFAYGLGTKKAVLPGIASAEFKHNPIFGYDVAGWYNEPSAVFSNTKYGIYIDSATTWNVWIEGGNSGYPSGGWNPEDIFLITLFPDKIEWKRNGEIIFTLNQAPAYPEMWPGAYMHFGQCSWTIRAGADSYVPR